MSGRFRLFLLALATLPFLAAAAEQPALQPDEGVLLLRNGELITGRITRSDDRYDVWLEDGEIHIRSRDVVALCHDVHECYEYRRADAAPDKVQDHLELAEWCIRHDLHTEAKAELATARECDATHPKIGLLERRLELSLEQPAQKAGSTADQKNASPEELDRMIRGMPAGCVEAFTTTIQPLLLNHCSTAACHGPQSKTTLRLLRTPAGRTPSRRSTQRNLYAALSVIDLQQPEQSPLLNAPIRAHGSARSPIFTNREALQYRQLMQWVHQVANTKPSDQPVTVEEPPSPLLQTVRATRELPQPKLQPRTRSEAAANGHKHTARGTARQHRLPPATNPDDSESEEVIPAGLTSGGEAASTAHSNAAKTSGLRPFGEGAEVVEPAKGNRAPGNADAQPADAHDQRGEADTEFTPKDPFDPEIFNRSFFGK